MKHYIYNLLLALALLFIPIKASMIMVMVLVALDFLFGVWASKKRGDKISSTGFKRTVVKILVYEVCVMLAYLVESYLTQDFLPATKIATSFVALTELKSILENLEDIAGMPILRVLIDKLSQQDMAATLVEGYNPMVGPQDAPGSIVELTPIPSPIPEPPKAP